MKSPMYFFLAIWLPFASKIFAFEFSEEKITTGVYFVKLAEPYISIQTYPFLYYYDLNEYHDHVNSLNGFVSKMGIWCEYLRNIIQNNDCLALVEELNTHLKDAELKKNYILSISKERSDNLMTAEEVQDVRESLKMYGGKLYTPVSNTLTEIKEKFDLVTREKEFGDEDLFNGLYILLNRSLTEISYYLDRLNLVAHKRDSASTCRDLIPIEQLQNDIQTFSSEKQGESLFPINNSNYTTRIFETMTPKLIGRMIILQANIPMISKTQYELYKVVSVPLKTFDNSISLSSSSFYFKNEAKKEFLHTICQSEDCFNFINFSDGKLLSFPSLITNLTSVEMKNDYARVAPCEFSLFFNQNITKVIENCDFRKNEVKDQIIPMNAKSYYISVESSSTVTINCSNYTFVKEIDRSGVLTVDNAQCELIYNDTKIENRNQWKEYEIKIPRLNFDNLSVKDIELLKNKAEMLESKQTDDPVSIEMKSSEYYATLIIIICLGIEVMSIVAIIFKMSKLKSLPVDKKMKIPNNFFTREDHITKV